MDWFPLLNSLRIAMWSTGITFFVGIFAAWEIAKLPRGIKGIVDCLLTLPLVLPPTVVGFFLLKGIGPKGWIGTWVMGIFDQKMVMTWYASVLATSIITFPLLYRTARGAFEAFDETLIQAGQTLGMSNTYLFWRIVLPECRHGIVAGVVLTFARGLGEYGATTMVSGYTPGRTATISTTVYQLWRQGNDALAYRWVFLNLIISLLVLVMVNLFGKRTRRSTKHVGA